MLKYQKRLIVFTMENLELKITKVIVEDKPFSEDSYKNIKSMMQAQGINCQ